MKKSKRQDLVTMIVKQNHIYKKADIIDYIPVKANQYEYKLLTQQSQLDSRVRLNDYIKTEIINTMIKESYILIKTTPGFAQSINYYIDQLQLKEIIGTISGNDTIMILTHSQSIAEYVYYKIFNHNYS
ncbi:MAG: ArgR family transcriptional regulator [Staphylococcus epidermidis]|nr:ArgR family transcriptional regulator [Staphylococcus epidermidis]